MKLRNILLAVMAALVGSDIEPAMAVTRADQILQEIEKRTGEKWEMED